MEVTAARQSEQSSQRVQPGFTIRAADERDCDTILAFIKELAAYERLLHEVSATVEDVRQSLFGPVPRAEVVLAYAGDEPAGFALFFHNYSTFLARHGLYLEDLYVRPRFRGQGCGKRLLAHLASVARDRHCGRMEWAVLDWNESAISFYQGLGARNIDGWKLFRLTGSSLNELADDA